MIFPFAIIRRFKLPESDFNTISSEEIIDRIYADLIKEKFREIVKHDLSIEFKGNFERSYFSFLPTTKYTYCIDFGKVTIMNSNSKRFVLYKFHYFKLFLILIIFCSGLSLFVGILVKSVIIGLITLGVISMVLLINWLMLFFLHPLTISNTLEYIRIEKLKMNNNNC